MNQVLADLVVLIHLAFILFVVFGGLIVLQWPRIAWLHLPCAAWGALIEFAGWICPLTPLEQKLRIAAGENGYAGSFIDHYIVPIVYPADLTRSDQIWLGLVVIAINALAYSLLLWRRWMRKF